MKGLTKVQLLVALFIGGLVGVIAWATMNQSLERRQKKMIVTRAINSMRRGDYLVLQNKETKALALYEASLSAINKENEPIAYANIKNSQGVCYYKMSHKENQQENLVRAIASYNEAISVYNSDGRLSDLAITLINTGDAYTKLAQYQNAVKNRLEAKKVYQKALKIYTKKSHPDKYETITKKIRELSGQ